MSDTFETVVKNFSGLSSETKPTIAAGYKIPNGSRWRELNPISKEVKIFIFNLSDDNWYEMPGLGASVTEGNAKKQLVQDNNTESLLTGILKEQKKTNLYLAIMTDNYIQDTEVE